MLIYVFTRLDENGVAKAASDDRAILKDTGLFNPRDIAESFAASGPTPSRVRLELYNHGATIGVHRPLRAEIVEPRAG